MSSPAQVSITGTSPTTRARWVTVSPSYRRAGRPRDRRRSRCRRTGSASPRRAPAGWCTPPPAASGSCRTAAWSRRARAGRRSSQLCSGRKSGRHVRITRGSPSWIAVRRHGYVAKVEVRREEILAATIARDRASGHGQPAGGRHRAALGVSSGSGLLPLRHQGRAARGRPGVRRRPRPGAGWTRPWPRAPARPSDCAASSRRTVRPAPPRAGRSGSTPSPALARAARSAARCA